MKKIILGFLAFVLALLGVGGIFAYVQYQKFNTEFGLTPAQPISHETLINPATRTQLVLSPALFKGFIQRHLPPTVVLPSWVPYKVDDLLDMAMPYRVAVLGNMDYTRGSLDFLAFVNEKMLGPLLVNQVKEGNFLAQAPMIKWDPAGVQLNQRGSITVSGALPLPEGLDRFVQDNSLLGVPKLPIAITGEHLWEFAIDNGNGELLSIVGLVLGQMQQDWRKIFEAKEFKMANTLFNKISVVKAHGDMVSDDEMKIYLRVDALPDQEFVFNMIKSMGMPEIKRYLKDNLQLELIGDPAWNKEEKAFIGDLQLKGLEKYLAPIFANIKVG